MPRLVLPDYAKPDIWLDDDNAIEFITWEGEETPYSAFWWHRPGPKGARHEAYCFGGFQWRQPHPDIHGPLWQLVSLDPLTVQPSLHCLTCGAHGFIEAGKWKPAG